MPPAAALRPDAPAAPLVGTRTAAHRFCCAWCEAAIGREPATAEATAASAASGTTTADSSSTATSEPVLNYGICPRCLEAQLARLGARKPVAQLVRRAPQRPAKAALGARR